MALNGPVGALYFGLLLGSAVFTRIATPLVLALFGAAAVLPLGPAVTMGVGFGLGRSVVAVAGAVTGGRVPPTSVVAIVVGPRLADRFVATIAGAICIGGLWWLLLAQQGLGRGALW